MNHKIYAVSNPTFQTFQTFQNCEAPSSDMMKKQSLGCKKNCDGICAAGAAIRIEAYIEGCLVVGGGVGTPFCSILCGLLVTFGCAYGCGGIAI